MIESLVRWQDALEIHRRAVQILFQNRNLLKWYKSTLLTSLVATLILFSLVFTLGTWALWDGLSMAGWGEFFKEYEVVLKGLFSVFWVLVILFLTVFLGAQISSVFMQLFGGDSKLFKIFYLSRPKNDTTGTFSQATLKMKKSYFLYNEWKAIFLNIVATFLFWPLLLIPFLLPLGLLVFAWGLGKEVYASSEKMYFENNVQTWSELGRKPTWTFYVALGFPAVLFGMIPLLGVLGFPLTRISGLLAGSPEAHNFMKSEKGV